METDHESLFVTSKENKTWVNVGQVVGNITELMLAKLLFKIGRGTT
jgi:hypothetical protein